MVSVGITVVDICCSGILATIGQQADAPVNSK